MVSIKHQLGARVHDDHVIFGVWAPFAASVSLQIDDNGEHKTVPMTSSDDGYYHLTTNAIHVGQNYRYLITTPDGTELERNDPYARRLTSSSGGWSVVVEDTFDWSNDTFTPGPIKGQVVYELHVGTFNRFDPATPGTFDTVIEKIDYLQNLGITAIELLPVTSMMDDTGWGYAPTHLFSIENAYGGRYELMRLVNAAHTHGIAVIIDIVYNHLAPENNLVRFDGWHEGDYAGIYFYNDERGKTPWGDRPDYGRPEVRQYLLDNVAMWFQEFHVDGLRLDATYYIDKLRDISGRELLDIPDGYSLLQEMTKLARSVKPSAYMIAEDSGYNDDATAEHGLGFTAQWATRYPSYLRAALGIDTAQNLDTFIGELQRYFNDDAFQKIIYSDSHDSAANGHQRLNAEAGGESKSARQKALIASTVAFTAPGVPMILQGEEFLEDGYFNGWRAMDWHQLEEHPGITAAHRDLIRLRKELKGLSSEGFQLFHVNYNDAVLGYGRWSSDNTDDALIVINFGQKSFDAYEIVMPRDGDWDVVFNSTAKAYGSDLSESPAKSLTTTSQGVSAIKLDGYQTLIYRRRT
jgi:1,4-alpha-glucan branching enzyme